MKKTLINQIPQDKLGREIQVGQIIAYGHALGRCAALRIGKVLKITLRGTQETIMSDGKIWRPWLHTMGSPSPIPNPQGPDETIIDHQWTITVIGIDHDSNRTAWNLTTKPTLCGSKGSLQFPERTLILDPTSLPQETKDLLDPLTDGTNIKKHKLTYGV